MDFAWVVDALRRGLKVTRKAWAGDPPMYLYTSKTKNGKRTVMFCDGSKVDREACFRPDAVLDATDWEEYVEPKKPVPGDTQILQSIRETTGSSEVPCGQAVEDQSDYAKEARKTIKVGEDTGCMAEQLEMLADIYAEKISQRVVQLLQAAKGPDPNRKPRA